MCLLCDIRYVSDTDSPRWGGGQRQSPGSGIQTPAELCTVETRNEIPRSFEEKWFINTSSCLSLRRARRF